MYECLVVRSVLLFCGIHPNAVGWCAAVAAAAYGTKLISLQRYVHKYGIFVIVLCCAVLCCECVRHTYARHTSSMIMNEHIRAIGIVYPTLFELLLFLHLFPCIISSESYDQICAHGEGEWRRRKANEKINASEHGTGKISAENLYIFTSFVIFYNV